MITLPELLDVLNNYFDDESIAGDFTISGGAFINLPTTIMADQWYKIDGSVFNDGIYQKGKETTLKDETFAGYVSAMRVPPAIDKLLADINAWITAKGDDQGMTGVVSESFDGYSYTKATNEKGMPATWREVFSKQIVRYKKI